MYNNNKSIFIVIPVHNRKHLTRICLLSLRKQTYQTFTTIVIDDGSSDGTGEMIQKEFPEVVLLRGDGSLWWTGATNLGVKYALSHADKNDYILTLNDDTKVGPTYLKDLLGSALKYPNSLIGSISISDSDELTIVDAGIRINWLTAKFNRLKKYNQYEDISNTEKSLYSVDVLPGRGTIIPAEVFWNIGLYNVARLPHYGADYEFSRRAKKCGYKLYIDYKAVVLSHLYLTGINNEMRNLTWIELAKSFFSIRSPNNIRYRWNFARLTCPIHLLPTFYLFDIGRVIFGTIRNQFKSDPQPHKRILT